jgi:hypothetical protein
MHRSALFAFAVLAGACVGASACSTTTGSPVVGGYVRANPSDPTLAEAERLAVDEIYRRDPQRSLVQSVTRETQVVEGMNYRFTVKMTGTNTYRIVVFRPLDGAMSVTSFEKILAEN